ncbi:MAG TPA: hypothetical protein PKA98_07600 [Acidimicrobiales bacterium]|nr:hypothetical protein [Acidimicrobiales bacterium]
MNTRKSISLLTIGVVMAAVTLLGVFALISDTAETGTFSVESQDEATSVDLQINNQGGGPLNGNVNSSSDCAASTYVENQTVPFNLNVDDVAPGAVETRYVCVRNVGSQAAHIDLELFGTGNSESGCTGDESDYDLLTCGTGAGELGDDLDVSVTQVGAAGLTDTFCNEPDGPGTFRTVTYDGVADTAPQSIGGGAGPQPLQAGESACYRVDVTYPVATPSAEVQENQSDQVDWQFRFHGDLT